MGFLDGVTSWAKQAAGTVAGAAQDVAKGAQNSVVVQTVGAIATGGLSLAAQAAYAAATGESNPVTRAAEELVKDPLKTASKVPGVLVSENLGLPIIAGGLRGAGRIAGSSTLSAAADYFDGANKALQDNPGASLGIIGGVALMATGAGTAAGVSMLAGSAGQIALQTVQAQTQTPTAQSAALGRPRGATNPHLGGTRSAAAAAQDAGASDQPAREWPGLLPWIAQRLREVLR